MPLKLTKAEIEAAKTPKGGFTRETLAGWGVSWPPPHGWRKALLAGDAIPEAKPRSPKAYYVRHVPDDAPRKSKPDSSETKLLHEVVMAVINAGRSDILKGIDDLNAYYGCKIPTVEDIVGGRPETAIIEGGITFEDKVYRFSVARRA
jgi:hypothetical protein